MAIEEELENALIYRAALVLNAAARAVFDFAFIELHSNEGHPSEPLTRLRLAANDIRDAEALTAVILNRCGASWDVLATGFEVSKQTLHGRLVAPGEAAYQSAQNRPELNVDEVRRATHRLSVVIPDTAEDALAAVAEAASVLAERRRTPRWWAPGW